ncbi:cytochrome c oxidase subunit 3 [Echinicola vietnamensis]|nr:hypothetical protein [Echinicola vietnamensis]
MSLTKPSHDEMKKRNFPSMIKKAESLHPYQLLVYLAMVSSGIIFLFLAVAFVVTAIDNPVVNGEQLPWPFWVSTFLIVSSNFWTRKLVHSLENDQPLFVKQTLWTVFLVGFMFVGFQGWGWIALTEQGVLFTAIPSGSYLYVLTGIHMLHLLGAMVFVLLMIYEVKQVMANPIKGLVFRKNPYVDMKVKLFVLYWKFVEIVWLVLFLLFVLAL